MSGQSMADYYEQALANNVGTPMTEEQMAQRVTAEWITSLEFDYIPESEAADLIQRIAAALRGQREPLAADNEKWQRAAGRLKAENEVLESRIGFLTDERDRLREDLAKWYGRAMATAQECQRLNSEK